MKRLITNPTQSAFTSQLALASIMLTSTLLTGALLVGCKSSEQKELAPESEVLKEDKAAATSIAYQVNSEASQVNFLMDAELEKISGRAPKSTSGTVNVDLMDLSKTTGLVKIDLLQLSIFQKKRESSDKEFGAEVKSEKQNEHMRTWLQISEDGPKEQREANRYAEFKITKVEPKTNVSAMKGNERKAEVLVTGTLRLHGRSSEHAFKADAIFEFQGDKAVGFRVVGKDPLRVGLEEHDVHPRSAFDVLADKTLETLGSKVAKVAEVSLEIVARAE